MILSIVVFLLLFYLNKKKKIKISTKNIFLVILSLWITILLILQPLISNNKIFELHEQSSLTSTELETVNKDGYIGEVCGDKYIIYQKDKDLTLDKSSLDIKKGKTEKLSRLDITNISTVDCKNEFYKFLVRDVGLYFFINKEDKDNSKTTTIYVLSTTKDTKIKGM